MASGQPGHAGCYHPPVLGGKTEISKTHWSPCDEGSAQEHPTFSPSSTTPDSGAEGPPEGSLGQH